jgi:hypothetical protein
MTPVTPPVAQIVTPVKQVTPSRITEIVTPSRPSPAYSRRFISGPE